MRSAHRGETLLLDNSVQIDRITEVEDRVNHVNRVIGRRPTATSSLVVRQFKSTIINNCIALLDIVESANSVADVDTAISRQFRYIDKIVKIKGQLERECSPEGIFDKELWVATLRYYVRRGMLTRFFEDIAYVADGSRCDLARKEVREERGFFRIHVSCNRQTATCSLPNLYERRADAANRLRDAVDDVSDPDDKRFLTSRLATWDGAVERHGLNALKGRVNCGKLSDLTIALEAERGETVVSTDHHHKLICAALGKPCKHIEYPSQGRAASLA